MQVLEQQGMRYKVPGELSVFQEKMYIHLIDWKWENITRDPGIYKYKGQEIEYDALLPAQYLEQMPHIYQSIQDDIKDHQKKYYFKIHKFFNHMASSQAANINLFLPILLSPRANEILTKIKPDFQELAVNELYKGFRIEYWDGNSNKEKGSLNDHTAAAGTDSDMAIAYYNTSGDLCLWLIEHKLTEKEFTTCGGYKTDSNKKKNLCSSSFNDIIIDKNLCHYHRVNHFKYWEITENYDSFFKGFSDCSSCPFKDGMNQLWRNQILAFSVEDQGHFKEVSFSVVKHPENTSLDKTMNEYTKLTGNDPRFTVIQSSEIIDAAQSVEDQELANWVEWYRELYLFR